MQGQEYCTVRVCRGMHVFGCMMQVWQPAIMWREGRLDRRIKRQFNARYPPFPPTTTNPTQIAPKKWRKPTSHQIKIISLPFNCPWSRKQKKSLLSTLPNSHLMRQPTGLITEEAGSSRKSPQKPLLLPGIHKDLAHYPKGYRL